MSHTVKINTQFKTQFQTSFTRALAHFGWTIKENSKIRTYPGDRDANVVYPMIAVNPNTGYDIGMKINETTGEIEMFGDFYDGSLAKTLGDNLTALKQEYSCCVIEDQLAYEGYSTTREVDSKGVIDIIAE